VKAPDDDGIAGADSDEEGEVGAALALAMGREKQLQAEVARHTGGRRDGGGGGDSNDDDDDEVFAQVGAWRFCR
jgi:hypothetical protein